MNVPPGDWKRDRSDGYAYTYGAAVKFADLIGIDLSISRQYNAQQKLVYHVVGDNKAVCGNNDEPASAGKIMMKRQ